MSDRTTLLCNSFLIKVFSNINTQIHKTINQFYSRNQRSKRKKKRLIIQCIGNVINIPKNLQVSNHYDVYYNTVTTSISINIEVGNSFIRNENPNSTLNNFLLNQDSYIIYTDGSKIAGSICSGWACICKELNIPIKKSVSNTASVFTTECIALNDAHCFI